MRPRAEDSRDQKVGFSEDEFGLPDYKEAFLQGEQSPQGPQHTQEKQGDHGVHQLPKILAAKVADKTILEEKDHMKKQLQNKVGKYVHAG